MNKLAITGLSGNSGKFFWRAFCNNPLDEIKKWGGIKTISRNSKKLSFLNDSNIDIPVEILSGDINEYKTAKLLCEGCDTLLHIAGIHSSKTVVSAAADAGVNRMILVHTTGIYSKYKLAGEEYRKIDQYIYDLAKEKDIRLTILRPTMIYGDLSDGNISFFIKMADYLPFIPLVNGGHYVLQPVHCSDLGKAYNMVLLHPDCCDNKDFVLSGGEVIELRAVFKTILKYLNKNKLFVSCPFCIAYLGAWIIYVITFGKRDFREQVQRLCEPRAYPYSEAEKAFGYNPLTFVDGVKNEVSDYLIMKNQK